MRARHTLFTLLAVAGMCYLQGQPFYLGADLSYVNELEDCGVVYKENGKAQDPYHIFADHGANLVRLRLWHSPAWYEQLNSGKRYSDLADVRRSIRRARETGMAVLLNFHLSDNWADPSKQIVPAAWAGVVNNLPILKDSLYRYIHGTLSSLAADGLLPDIVQIGNETNRGILQSKADNDSGWKLDWNRNAQLFNRAIEAVREVEKSSGKPIEVALHIAGPAEADWLARGFWSNGVRDFDIIGLSYYWAWHRPTTIAQVGQIIAQLRQAYPGKEVMILETGYIWTTAANDAANNIISEVHPEYAPASPANQRRWLIDLTQEVVDRGGRGVLYWEPAWVSSSCRTQWGQGSHQEHATFFDFNNNVIAEGGIRFFAHPYNGLVGTREPSPFAVVTLLPAADHRSVTIELPNELLSANLTVRLFALDGRQVLQHDFRGRSASSLRLSLPRLNNGLYVFAFYSEGKLVSRQKMMLSPY